MGIINSLIIIKWVFVIQEHEIFRYNLMHIAYSIGACAKLTEFSQNGLEKCNENLGVE